MIHINRIGHDGEITEITATEETLLQTLQDAVGGYIERVRPLNADGKYMMVNESGLLYGLPLNLTATLIAGQPIVGSVAMVDISDFT
jgi:hypothetical protein